MRFCCVWPIAGAALLVGTGMLVAQETGESDNVIQQLNAIDHGTLSVLMIFGTGLVASLCWGIGWIISCLRAGGADSESLRDEIAALETRLATLEQAAGSAVGGSSVVH